MKESYPPYERLSTDDQVVVDLMVKLRRLLLQEVGSKGPVDSRGRTLDAKGELAQSREIYSAPHEIEEVKRNRAGIETKIARLEAQFGTVVIDEQNGVTIQPNAATAAAVPGDGASGANEGKATDPNKLKGTGRGISPD